MINGIGMALVLCQCPTSHVVKDDRLTLPKSLRYVLSNIDPFPINREVIALLKDKYLIPDTEFSEWYIEEGNLENMEETLFSRAKEIVTQLIMVIPITKQRLNNCLVAFMFVAVFKSLLFMVVTLIGKQNRSLLFMV